MDSYRFEVQEAMKIALPDQDAEIGPVPTSGGGRKPEPEIDRLSNIINAFNDQFGNMTGKTQLGKRIDLNYRGQLSDNPSWRLNLAVVKFYKWVGRCHPE